MTLDRRQALGVGVGALALGAAGAAQAQSTPYRLRQSAQSLTATSDTVVAFAEGVRLMKARRDSLSWDALNRIHARQAQHGNEHFLPWHRVQIMHMERIIGRLTGMDRWALPYWDWQAQPIMPSWLHDVRTSLYERQRNPGVASLDFARARWAASADSARVYEDSFVAFFGQQRAAGRVEAYGHNIIHMLVGGYMGSVATAALDPVFWMHHCNVDRVWDTWHRRSGRAQYPQAWLRRTHSGFTGPDGRTTGSWSNQRVIDIRNLGYGYDRDHTAVFFAVAPGAGVAPAAPEQPSHTSTYRFGAQARRGESGLTAAFPPELMQRLSRTDRRFEIDGLGTIAYERSVNLVDRVITTDVMANGRRVGLGSSPTFVHLPEATGGHAAHHADHAVGDPYAHVFTFDRSVGQSVAQLATFGREPLRVVSTSEDVRPDLRRPQAQAVSLECTVTLREYGGPPEPGYGQPAPLDPRRPGSGYYGERG